MYLELLQHDVKRNGLVEDCTTYTYLQTWVCEKNKICRIMQASFCKRHNLCDLQVTVACGAALFCLLWTRILIEDI